MQLEKEFKNMVNNVAIFKFNKENKILELELDTPNFSNFVREIIVNNYEVTQENIKVSFKEEENNTIDIDELKRIIIEIHKQYVDEISKFYEYTKNTIQTYYESDEDIVKEIKKYINEFSSKKNE